MMTQLLDDSPMQGGTEARVVFPETPWKAALALCSRAFEKKRPTSILLFGLSGSGKTSFAYSLSQHFKVPSARVTGSDLAFFVPAERHGLTECQRKISESVGRARLAFIDELDSLPKNLMLPIISTVEKELSKNRRDGSVLLATTCDPSRIGPDTLARFQYTLYVPIADQSAAISLLRKLGVKKAEEVERYLVTYLKGTPPPTYALARACYEASSEGLLKGNPKEIAQALAARISQSVDGFYLEKYEISNSQIISRSIETANYWSRSAHSRGVQRITKTMLRQLRDKPKRKRTRAPIP